MVKSVRGVLICFAFLFCFVLVFFFFCVVISYELFLQSLPDLFRHQRPTIWVMKLGIRLWLATSSPSLHQRYNGPDHSGRCPLIVTRWLVKIWWSRKLGRRTEDPSCAAGKITWVMYMHLLCSLWNLSVSEWFKNVESAKNPLLSTVSLFLLSGNCCSILVIRVVSAWLVRDRNRWNCFLFN